MECGTMKHGVRLPVPKATCDALAGDTTFSPPPTVSLRLHRDAKGRSSSACKVSIFVLGLFHVLHHAMTFSCISMLGLQLNPCFWAKYTQTFRTMPVATFGLPRDDMHVKQLQGCLKAPCSHLINYQTLAVKLSKMKACLFTRADSDGEGSRMRLERRYSYCSRCCDW